jgi:LmbE family N-acetylglucosaminyl deacetylase
VRAFGSARRAAALAAAGALGVSADDTRFLGYPHAGTLALGLKRHLFEAHPSAVSARTT